jgi:hypothetical protein
MGGVSPCAETEEQVARAHEQANRSRVTLPDERKGATLEGAAG